MNVGGDELVTGRRGGVSVGGQAARGGRGGVKASSWGRHDASVPRWVVGDCWRSMSDGGQESDRRKGPMHSKFPSVSADEVHRFPRSPLPRVPRCHCADLGAEGGFRAAGVQIPLLTCRIPSPCLRIGVRHTEPHPRGSSGARRRSFGPFRAKSGRSWHGMTQTARLAGRGHRMAQAARLPAWGGTE